MRLVKGAGQSARTDIGLTMHGSRSERRLLTQQSGRSSTRGRGRGFLALGPSREEGKATPRRWWL